MQNTGLVEVPVGIPLREVVYTIGGGAPEGHQIKAVQIGGPSGGCIPDACLDVPADYGKLQELGAMMGSGGMVVMDERTCMVDVAKYFMEFIRNESCGKCTPCREGTTRMHEILIALTERPVGDEIRRLERFRGLLHLEELAQTIKDTSLCGLGQSAANPVLSTLRFFRDEYEAHIMEDRCPAGVCQGLRTYQVDNASCIGCMACKKNCPSGAIVGSARTLTTSSSTSAWAAAPAWTPARNSQSPWSPGQEVIVNITINDRDIKFNPGETVLQVANRAGIRIPHLCSLDWAPSPSASCRLCVVEVEGSPRLQTSCTLQAAEGMKSSTHTPRVMKARRSIVELMVANHPQDCLACDRAGSCELADLTRKWASGPGSTWG